MSKALFFNALPDTTSQTGYDRNYNADDLSDFLSMVCDTGVVKTNTEGDNPQGLKVVATSGMVVNVKTGKASIKGKAFINDTLEAFTVAANGTGANRYDYIVLKYDNNVSVRNIKLELRTGTSSIPTAAVLANTEKVKELMLAYIRVAPSATSITQGVITDTRGNASLCPWFTAVKGYDDYYDAIVQTHESTKTLTSISNTVITDLPSSLYNGKYSLIDVYTNGIKEPKTAFSASVSGGYIVITFTAQKAVGTKITVILNNFIDGEGMATALTQYTQLVQDVADLNNGNEFNYVCNGVNDNVLISNIVRSFFSVNDYKRLKLNIIGNVGMSAPAVGTGETTNPYSWFNFTKQVETSRLLTLDFTNASGINPTLTDGTSNYIFRGEDINIIGASVIVSNTTANTNVKVFGTTSGRIYAEHCRFWVTAYNNSLIASTGTFVNCRGSVANAASNSYCFNTASGGILRLYGGEWYAYTGDSGLISGIIGQSGADAVSILYGVNAPQVARSGYTQKYSIYQTASGGMVNCTDLISVLPLEVKTGISNIRGTISKNKPNLM